MKNLITQRVAKNNATELEFTFDENLDQIFEKCLLIKGVVIINFVEASDSPKRE